MRVHRWPLTALAVVVLGAAVGLMMWAFDNGSSDSGSSSHSFRSPRAAVIAVCHADPYQPILKQGPAPPLRGGPPAIYVGWEAHGMPAGDQWVAFVERAGVSRYRVVDCKDGSVTGH